MKITYTHKKILYNDMYSQHLDLSISVKSGPSLRNFDVVMETFRWDINPWEIIKGLLQVQKLVQDKLLLAAMFFK